MNFTRILQRPLYILGEYPQFPLCEGNIFEWLIRKRHFPRNVCTTFCDYVILILWSSPQAFVVFAEL